MPQVDDSLPPESGEKLMEGLHGWLRRFPQFHDWYVSVGQSILDSFEPGVWYDSSWQKRVRSDSLHELYGHPIPGEYLTLLQALTFTAPATPYEIGSAIGLLPRPAHGLVRHGYCEFLRYDDQPKEFFPCAHTGVDGGSFDFYFSERGYIIAHFEPMDFGREVQFSYTGICPFVTAHLLNGLEWTEKDTVNEYTHNRYAETMAVITALGLNIPEVGYQEYAEEETEHVRQMVRQGEYPVLKRWLLAGM